MTLGIFSNFPILVLKVINFYMELLAERSTSDLKLPKVYAFNTFFYGKLRTEGYSSLRQWTKNVGIDMGLNQKAVLVMSFWCSR